MPVRLGPNAPSRSRTPFVEHVSVDHRRAHVFVPEKFLHCANVVAVLQQMRGKTVTKRMTARRLTDARFSHGVLHCVLQILFVHMMASLSSGARINGSPFSGKNVLPCPFP